MCRFFCKSYTFDWQSALFGNYHTFLHTNVPILLQESHICLAICIIRQLSHILAHKCTDSFARLTHLIGNLHYSAIITHSCTQMCRFFCKSHTFVWQSALFGNYHTFLHTNAPILLQDSHIWLVICIIRQLSHILAHKYTDSFARVTHLFGNLHYSAIITHSCTQMHRFFCKTHTFDW